MCAMIPLIVFGVVTAIVAVIFAVQNTAPVTVSFLTWNFTGSLAIVLIATLGAGVLSTLAMLSPLLVKGKWLRGGMRKRIEELERETPEEKPKPNGDPPIQT